MPDPGELAEAGAEARAGEPSSATAAAASETRYRNGVKRICPPSQPQGATPKEYSYGTKAKARRQVIDAAVSSRRSFALTAAQWPRWCPCTLSSLPITRCEASGWL